jgi:hypothetical protein
MIRESRIGGGARGEMPADVAVRVAEMRAAGWVEIPEAIELSGRDLHEIAMLQISGEVTFAEVGLWWSGEVPRVVPMVELASLLNAPRRTPLRLAR